MAMTQPTNDERHLAAVESSAPATTDIFNDARVDLIRNQVAKGAPNDKFEAMIDIARINGLNPLTRQVGLVNYKSKGADNWQIVIFIDGYRNIADQSGVYAGNDAPVFQMRDEKTSWQKPVPDSATVTVWKMVGGQRHPFSETVYWDEYNAGRNNWVSMPRTMLAKVAEAHALRKAFPARLSGTYIPEEMDQATVDVQGRVVNQTTGEIHQTPQQAMAPAVEQPTKMTAMKRLHAVGRDHGIDHDVLHKMAERGWKVKSLTDLDAGQLGRLADRIEGDPQAAQEFARAVKSQAHRLETTDEEAIEAAMANSTPVRPGENEPPISDAEYMAGTDVSRQPQRPAMSLEPTGRQRKLIDVLCSQLNFTGEELDAIAQEHGGAPMATIDRRGTTNLITELQRIKQERQEA